LKRFIEDDDDRAGTWSVPVSGNWRITFTLDSGEICNLNLEDYH
jgi:proteic killer suppression protein